MAKVKNERKTENLVRDALRDLGYYAEENHITVEEQKSEAEQIRRLLRNGSKSKAGGVGAPEFIITCARSSPDFVVVIECKAHATDHQSPNAEMIFAGDDVQESEVDCIRRLTRYGVDGVLHYASKLSKDYNVIAVAVSGETKSGMRVSTFLHGKGAGRPKYLVSKIDESKIEEILPWSDYLDHAVFDPAVRLARLDDLMAFARELHVFMRDHAKLTESEKPLLVSGTLIALQNKPFAAAYELYSAEALPKAWMKAIRDEINDAEIPQAKKDNMTQPYASIAVHPELGKISVKWVKGVLYELIRMIQLKAAPLMAATDGTDILGQFYGEFLKYTGGDKKALGIVLTPRHITELFALIGKVNKKSIVLDICAGTGGFLVSAMSEMMRGANTEAERNRIKMKGLIGIEQQPNMFALAASNMILRGDGKANLFQGSCFEPAITKAVAKFKADVGMLNPPFSQGDADLHELRFVQQMLDLLAKGGIGIAIVPMSCAISPHPLREELLREHTLEAVMSMPTELFYPVGVVTCIMVFTAHVPHKLSNRKTWFGYWKEDGFVKTKHKGRVDLDSAWSEIRGRWITSYLNREVHPGESVLQQVSASDEWCAEAYMETDYSTLGPLDMEDEIRKYVVYRIMNEGDYSEVESDFEAE